jgi:hypothetical protein
MQTVVTRLFPCSVFSLKINKTIQSPSLTDDIIDDISSIEHVTYPNRLDCGGARLSGNWSEARVGNCFPKPTTWRNTSSPGWTDGKRIRQGYFQAALEVGVFGM